MAGHLAKLGFWASTCLEFFEHKVSHALAAASAGEVFSTLLWSGQMFGTCSVCKVPTQTRMLEAYSSISNSGKTKEEGKLSFEFDPFDFSCLLFCFAGRSPWATTLQDLFFSLLSHRSLLNFCKLGLIKDGSSLKFIQTAALNKGQVTWLCRFGLEILAAEVWQRSKPLLVDYLQRRGDPKRQSGIDID